MYKLKKGSLQTIVYNETDLNNYKNAGWKLVEETKKEEPKKEIVVEEETYKQKFEKPAYRKTSKYDK